MDRHPLLYRQPFAFAVALCASCVSYTAAPLDLAETVATLHAVELPELAPTRPGYTPLDLAAFAVHFHPSLMEARAELAVAGSKIAEAGLFPDVDFGWGAMDALVSEWSAGHTQRADYLGSLDLMLTLPRFGEREAQVDLASWRQVEMLQLLRAAEWQLAIDVQQACVEVLTSTRRLIEARALLEVSQKTSAFFARALQVGTATRTEVSLANGDYQAFRVDLASAEIQLRTANRELNALLGLRPGYEVALSAYESWALEVPERERGQLESEALENRTDVAAARAAFEGKEAALRLAISGQYPEVSIGTGVGFSLGLFNQFNRPAIETALRERVVAKAAFDALVFRIRGEVFAALQNFEDATVLLELIDEDLLGSAEASLAAIEAALGAGEVTLLETLIMQRSLGAIRKRWIDARSVELHARVALLSVTGQLAGVSTIPTETLR